MGKPHNVFDEKLELNKKEKAKIAALPESEQAAATAEALEKAKKDVKKLTLAPVAARLNELLGGKVTFAKDVIGDDAKAKVAALKDGECVLLENLRFHKGEEKKTPEFMNALASYADVYVNDAFGTAHRAHASTALIADYFPNDKMFGYVMENELKAIDGIMLNPERPFCAILGGSKVSTKISVIENLMKRVDNLILGGGMTYTFKAAQGGKVGTSICEPDQFQTALDILKKAEELNVKIYLAEDAVCGKEFKNDTETKICPSNDIPDGWEGLDIGPKATEAFTKVIAESKTILWNGPVGVFEMDNFAKGSRALAEAIVEATKKGAFSLIGGGDSVAAINKFGLAGDVSYVSTGGGALLGYMEGIELPGVAAIRK